MHRVTGNVQNMVMGAVGAGTRGRVISSSWVLEEILEIFGFRIRSLLRDPEGN